MAAFQLVQVAAYRFRLALAAVRTAACQLVAALVALQVAAFQLVAALVTLQVAACQLVAAVRQLVAALVAVLDPFWAPMRWRPKSSIWHLRHRLHLLCQHDWHQRCPPHSCRRRCGSATRSPPGFQQALVWRLSGAPRPSQ